MFHIDDNLVEIHFGNEAINEVAPTPDIITKLFAGKQKGDNLIEEIDLLRKKLASEDIVLPRVRLCDDENCSPYCIRIIIGIGASDYDVREYNWLDLLEKQMRDYQIGHDLQTYEGINALLDKVINMLSEKQYNIAMQQLFKLYYWCSLINYSDAGIKVLINIATILLHNNQMDNAFKCAQKAQALAEDDSFLDPYIKYQVHKYIGCISALKGDINSSSLFEKAYEDISRCGEVRFMMDALYNKATVCLAAQDYQSAADTLKRIKEIGRRNSTFTKDEIMYISDIYEIAMEGIIQRNQLNLKELQEKYARIKENMLIKLGNTAINVLCRIGPYIIAFAAGGLLGGEGVIITKGDSNIINVDNVVSIN